MKSLALTLLVLVASVVAGPKHKVPRPEINPTYLTSAERSSENSFAYRNSLGRIPAALQERVPNAANILSMSLEALEKRNDEEIVSSLDEVCNVAIATDAITPTYAPSKGQITVRIITKEGDTKVPLTQPQQIFEGRGFSQDNDNVILISGTKLNAYDDSSALSKLMSAYRCRGGVNFMHIELGDHLDTVNTWMSLDTEQVGQWVGEFLRELARNVPTKRIHLLGHSVGAHVAGAASRKFTELTGNTLPRITALDPARLCYRIPQTISGLQKGDAQFIDVIHTSAYGLGTLEAIGDVDFYPNGPITLQPGTRNLVAAQNKAMEYFAETVLPGNEENFMGYKCNSMKNLRSPACLHTQVAMGIATPTDVKGNYFLPTKQVSPYGNNAAPGVQNVHCREY